MDRIKFRSLTNDQQRVWILNFTKNHFTNETRGPVFRDFGIYGINRYDILRLFGNLGNLYVNCGFEPLQRGLLSDIELKDYFRSIAKICPITGCWTTDKIKSRQPGTNRKNIKYKGKTIRMHRLSYLLFRGALIAGQCVMHSCDNDGCFNPEHLEQGTFAKNNQDREIRGRGNHHRGVSTGPVHSLINPYDKQGLLAWVRSMVTVSEKNEWLYPRIGTGGYAQIGIAGKSYQLHRLILANKLGLKYENIIIACHKFPNDSSQTPARNDVNPDHLYNGTQSQNIRDALPYHKGVKISPDIRQEICDEIQKIDFSQAGLSNDFDARLAAKFKISPNSVQIIRRSLKKHGTREKPVVQLDKKGNIIKKFSSAREATKDGFNYKNISNVIYGHKKSHKGYLWKFA